jgi:hypothetical protein
MILCIVIYLYYIVINYYPLILQVRLIILERSRVKLEFQLSKIEIYYLFIILDNLYKSKNCIGKMITKGKIT